MPRVRWTTTCRPANNAHNSMFSCKCWCILLCCCFILSFMDCVYADCWYDDEKHEEGVEVATVEPCLNCTCSRGVLLCYLRVCPKLPNPPPQGCILLHRYRTCCPELICPDIPSGGNALEARSDPDDIALDVQYNKKLLGNACISNGSIYGPGSAMDSSSLCEYCYCLGGKQTCVRPKCLLPVVGCTPSYEPTNCCPVYYNCTRHELTSTTSSTTTTLKPILIEQGGCMVEEVYYPEGGKVLGVGHSICDNCYCLRGLLRCEPLSCAPPLHGCTPVIRKGECCAASYNCSGTIEIQPEPNYGQFPTVSKEYAKLRKEVQHKPSSSTKKTIVTENSNSPYYVIAESSTSTKFQHRSPGSFGTTRHFTGLTFDPSTIKPYYYDAMAKESLISQENKHSTRSYTQTNHPGTYYATTNYEFQNKNFKRVFSTTNKPQSTNIIPTTRLLTDNHKKEKLRSSDYLDLSDESLLSIVDSLLDVKLNRKIDNDSTTENSPTTTETSVDFYDTTLDLDSTTLTAPSTDDIDITTTEISTTENNEIILNNSHPSTLKSVLNTTDCTDTNESLVQSSNLIDYTTVLPVDANEINKLAELKTINDYTTTDFSSESSTGDDVTEVDLESKVEVSSVTLKSMGKIPPDIEAILNRTKTKEDDYDYDYNEPSLPPSLPNLRIIPFVAADALDSKKQITKENNLYPQERISDTSFGYSNLFSPPAETEGGFVPKEPPILETFYENAVTVPSITNAPKSNELDCLTEDRKIPHGQSVQSNSPCTTCTCFYGNIVCQKPECLIPRPGCRKSTVQDLNLCCPVYVCDDEEAPTVVLDRLEGTSNSKEVVTVAEGVITPDPFRDVIRTEPAPDLQSLIVDMMPYFARKTTPIPPAITTTTEKITTISNKLITNTTENHQEDDFSLDKVLQLLFSGDKDEKIESTTQILTSEPIKTTQKTTPVTITSIKKSKPPLTTTEHPEKHNNSKVKTKISNHINSVEASPPGVGFLKLAGCNIYGRMYRVGRIISELSGPCRECKCAETGILCKPLKC